MQNYYFCLLCNNERLSLRGLASVTLKKRRTLILSYCTAWPHQNFKFIKKSTANLVGKCTIQRFRRVRTIIARLLRQTQDTYRYYLKVERTKKLDI